MNDPTSEIKERITKFQEALKKLTEEHGISFKPQITADGPVNVFVDVKPKDVSVEEKLAKEKYYENPTS